MVLKNFIVFEGIDGAGTTTQQRLLKERLQSQFPHIGCHSTAEPTSGPTGTFLRSVLRGEVQVSPRTAAYLFAADRQEHLAATGGIEELCRNNTIVISDRYLFSSLAYQSAACGAAAPAGQNSARTASVMLFTRANRPVASAGPACTRSVSSAKQFRNTSLPMVRLPAPTVSRRSLRQL